MLLISLMLVAGAVGIAGRRVNALLRKREVEPTPADAAPPRAANTATPAPTPSWPASDDDATADAAKQVDTYLALSAGSLALATTGALLFPPLSLLSGAITLYSGIPVYKRAYNSLIKEKRLSGTFIDSLSILSALAGGFLFLDALGLTLYYGSRKQALRSTERSLAQLDPGLAVPGDTVWLLRDDLEVAVPLADVQAQDVIVVAAGQVVPVDGIVLAGKASVEQRRLTGIDGGLDCRPGDRILAASRLLSGRVFVEVEQTGDATAAAQLARAWQQAAASRRHLDRHGDVLADQDALPLLLLSGTALATLGSNAGIAVLSSNFADNLNVTEPLAWLDTILRAAELGLLLKDGAAFARLASIDTIVLDLSDQIWADDADPDTAAVVATLQARALHVCIVAPDDEAGRQLADSLGAQSFVPVRQSADKTAAVQRLQQQGQKVCFVGNRLADAEALRTADASVSRCGIDAMAGDPAQFVLLDGSLRRLPALFELSAERAKATRNSLLINTGTTLFTVGGIFFLHLRILAAIALYNASLAASVVSSLRLGKSRITDNKES